MFFKYIREQFLLVHPGWRRHHCKYASKVKRTKLFYQRAFRMPDDVNYEANEALFFKLAYPTYTKKKMYLCGF